MKKISLDSPNNNISQLSKQNCSSIKSIEAPGKIVFVDDNSIELELIKSKFADLPWVKHSDFFIHSEKALQQLIETIDEAIQKAAKQYSEQ